MRSGKAGYSLLEVLLVLTIVAGAGFLLLIQIPHSMEQKGIEYSAERMLEDLRETQQAAIAENSWYRIKFFRETNEYMIFRQGEFVRSVSLANGVNYGNNPNELTLLPTGAPAAGITVILTCGQQERRVIAAPVMGRIRLEIVR